jgi:hypothetical protein
MISIRLSEEEYLSLKQLCMVTGARSVSELTRDAMRVVLKGATRDDVLGLRMNEFRALLKSLDRKIDELAAGITSFKTGQTVANELAPEDEALGQDSSHDTGTE